MFFFIIGYPGWLDALENVTHSQSEAEYSKQSRTGEMVLKSGGIHTNTSIARGCRSIHLTLARKLIYFIFIFFKMMNCSFKTGTLAAAELSVLQYQVPLDYSVSQLTVFLVDCANKVYSICHHHPSHAFSTFLY